MQWSIPDIPCLGNFILLKENNCDKEIYFSTEFIQETEIRMVDLEIITVWSLSNYLIQ